MFIHFSSLSVQISLCLHLYGLVKCEGISGIAKNASEHTPICYWSDNQIAPPQTRVIG